MSEPCRAWKWIILKIPLCPLWPGKRWCGAGFRISFLDSFLFPPLEMLTPGRFPLRTSCHTVNAEALWRCFSSRPHLSSTIHGWSRECINLNIPNQLNLHMLQPQLTSDKLHETCHMQLDSWVRPRLRTLRDNHEWFQATEFWGGLLCPSRGTGTTPTLGTSQSECLHQMEWMSPLLLSGWPRNPPLCCLLYGIASCLPVVNVFTDPWSHEPELPLSFLSCYFPALLRNSLAPASQTEAGLPFSKIWLLFSVSCSYIHAFFSYLFVSPCFLVLPRFPAGPLIPFESTVLLSLDFPASDGIWGCFLTPLPSLFQGHDGDSPPSFSVIWDCQSRPLSQTLDQR